MEAMSRPAPGGGFFTAGRRVSFLNATTGGLPPWLPAIQEPRLKGGAFVLPASCLTARALDRDSAARLDPPSAVPDIGCMCGRFLNKLPGAEIARIFGTRNP